MVLRVADSISDFNRASRITIGEYRHLKKAFKGMKGIEVHHIIEKRLVGGFKKEITKSNMLSVPLEKTLHKKITKRWRKVVPYRTSGKNITKKEMISYCRQVYHDMPALKKATTSYVNKYWR